PQPTQAVSNTASYLRLWALSLAHAGLSEVFWERVMLNVLEMETHPVLHALAMFAGFAIWASMTFGVLMVMETLSACLHDIRLHWVEFQNKFYGGDGVVFTPLNFAAIVTPPPPNWAWAPSISLTSPQKI
ncbi:V-type ATPase 116kDa subunit family-domain-containing protein, partial [Baffinella frigidus]